MRVAAVSMFLLISIVSGPEYEEARAEGGGQVRIGYLYLDEEGNRGVNRESFNIYEGPVLSFENIYYITPDGLNVTADLKNLSLNNRDLRASLSKPGQFGLTLYNSQYRRVYSYDGDKYTRRRSAGGQGQYIIHEHFKIFGGFSRIDRHGEIQNVSPPYGEVIPFSADYSQTSFNLGGQAFFRKGNIRLKYRRFFFEDDLTAGGDRGTGNFEIDAFALCPRYEKLQLSGGYRYRREVHKTTDMSVKTNQMWLGTRLFLARETTIEYRFVASRSDHSRQPAQIDNYINTLDVGHNWSGRGGIRVGYENRISDDVLNQTVLNGFMTSGWFKYKSRLMFRGRISVRKKEVREGATLVGDEDFTRHAFSASYHWSPWGDLGVEYQRRVRTNDDIDTRAEYDAVSFTMNLSKSEYGRLDLTYSYYLGTAENRSIGEWRDYEFRDHVLAGIITLAEYRHTRWSFGGTYYRSKRDNNIEKINGHAGVKYLIGNGYIAEARYQIFNHDDFTILDNYYTGNIVEISFIKEFTF